MIKFIIISLLNLFFIFLLIKIFKNQNLKTIHLFIFFVIGIIIYFIYTGKITYLFAFLKNILPNLIKLLGI